MSALWQFGDEWAGLLIVIAETEIEACEKRDAWVAEQSRLEAAYRKWWAEAQRPDAGYWDSRRGFGTDGRARAEAALGPEPPPSQSYINLRGRPVSIGESFAFLWSE